MKLEKLSGSDVHIKLTESEFLTLSACTGVVHIGPAYYVDGFSYNEVDRISEKLAELRDANGIEI